LNCGTSDRKINYIKSYRIVKQPARIIELDDRDANVVLMEREPFEVFVEGRFLKESGEDRTAIELFLTGTRAVALDSRFIDTLRLIVHDERRKTFEPGFPR
jgi:hypothetical protein